MITGSFGLLLAAGDAPGGEFWHAPDGLFEVIGDHVGEEFPERPPDLRGAGKFWTGGIEGVPGMNQRHGITSVPASQALDESLRKNPGPPRMQECGLGRHSQLLR